MTIKHIIATALVAIILISCSPPNIDIPASTSLPVETTAPTKTVEPTSIPVATKTPAPLDVLPETLDLIAGIADYSIAYTRAVPSDEALFNSPEIIIERLVEVTGAALDGTPFIALIDPQTNTILFLQIPNTESGVWEWQQATVGALANLANISPYIGADYHEFTRLKPIYPKMCKENCNIVISGELQMNAVFRNFEVSDWEDILINWEWIVKQLTTNEIPKFDYNWSDADRAIKSYKVIFGPTMQIRAQHLLWPTIDHSEYGGITTQIFNMNLPPEDNLKLLEFMVRVRVIKYPEINQWDVTDEIIAGYVLQEQHLRTWQVMTNLTTTELIAKIAEWVKESNPNAITIVNEHGVFNYNEPWTKDTHDETMKIMRKLSAMNAPIDGFIDQQNLWIGMGIDEVRVEQDIRELQSLGFEIYPPEAIVNSNDTGLFDESPGIRPQVDPVLPGRTAEERQAEMYRQLFSLYYRLGIRDIGLSGVADFATWPSDPEAKPNLFDTNGQTKLAYFYIMRHLSAIVLGSTP